MLLIPHRKVKNTHLENPVALLQSPAELNIPLDVYNGSMQPVVAEGDTVLKYQLIAKSEGLFASYIHAPVSGTVSRIVSINGKKFLSIINDFREEKIPLKPIDFSGLSKEDILTIIKEYGIEGSGGAQFPTHLKYSVEKQNIDTLIINGAECEPYLTADYSLMKNYSDDLAKGIAIVQKLTGASEIVLGIERQNKELRTILEKSFAQNDLSAKVQLLPNTYPQGGELQLIKSVTAKELPKGSIPARHGVIVSNVGTIWAVFNAFYEGKPYVERMVTLYSEEEKKGGNYFLKIGTPVSHIVQHSDFGPNESSEGNYILGGPMMGKEVTDMRQPIQKGSGGLLFLRKPKPYENNCIACGYCADVCPQKLLPLEYVRNYIEGNTEKLKEYNLMDCIDCGACAYACPSDVPLMWSIRKGKEALSQLKKG